MFHRHLLHSNRPAFSGHLA